VGNNTSTKNSYIKVTTTKPAANFTSNATSGTVPLIVLFNDTSKGAPTAWRWSFGDGTANSTVKNPVHNYSKVGNYTVTLTVNNSAGSNTTIKSSYIKVTAVQRPVANFTSNISSGAVPLNIAFNDTSTNSPTSWKWSFGDGTSNSTLKNPTHNYSKVGNYTVTLTVSNSAGSSAIRKSSYIRVAAQKPIANFTSNVTSGTVPLSVAFTDTSTGSPTSWRWNFGDGTSNSTTQNPTHRYSSAGNYTVILTVTNTAGSNTVTKTSYIKVTAVKPVANFASNVTSGNAPLSVAFTDSSTGTPTAWNWNFGDGTANSTVKNPAHKYSSAGNYTVILTASNSAGSSAVAKSSYIKVAAAAQKPVAAFSASPTSGKSPLKVLFTDKSTGSPTSWVWNFGDGITSSTRNATHTYTKKGKFAVSLTVKNTAASNTKTTTGYITVT
jgi:PKD repeat protein